MFDDSGAIVSAPMAGVGAGPWSSLQDSYLGRLKVALAEADRNPHLRGLARQRCQRTRRRLYRARPGGTVLGPGIGTRQGHRTCGFQ